MTAFNIGDVITLQTPQGDTTGEVIDTWASTLAIRWTPLRTYSVLRVDFFDRDTLCRSSDLPDDPRAIRVKTAQQ